ncbi:HupE/UreJ family protein [Salipiger mucosus]|uniref:Membrane protein n=1 Tax=Salipiger mucosus DSM 16094 TaxID=1123237 RepID=S9SBN8_9RHOB|nr:HupE/UreJ family protein [Salipiger mucosus]EPX83624.1 Membrane protein [Salipiger mucosus DSM 16094]
MFRSVLALVLFCLSAIAASAHEVRPAVADLTTGEGRVEIALSFTAEPIVAGADLEGVEDTNDTARSEDVDALRALPPETMAERLRDHLPEILAAMNVQADGTPVSLGAAEIEVAPVGNTELPRDTWLVLEGALPDGASTVEVTWPASFGTLILRQQGVEEPYTGYLEGQSSGPIPLAGGGQLSGWQAFGAYIPVGFEHIVPLGLDHILFVLGLFFFSLHIKPLLFQVSAFTAAHTVTLALGALHIVRLPASIVEPIIAASIVFIAVENIVSRGMSPWRPAVVFVFGLLHGLGFAGVLEEFGLPQGGFVPALLGFNVGVELGQLFVIAVAFLAVGYWFGRKPWYRARIAVPASVAIAAVGSYWFVERVFL